MDTCDLNVLAIEMVQQVEFICFVFDYGMSFLSMFMLLLFLFVSSSFNLSIPWQFSCFSSFVRLSDFVLQKVLAHFICFIHSNQTNAKVEKRRSDDYMACAFSIVSIMWVVWCYTDDLVRATTEVGVFIHANMKTNKKNTNFGDK